MTETQPSRVRADLSGVPETLLWTLYNRAAEAGHPEAVLKDPKALELMACVDYPFADRLGPPDAHFSQIQGLRSRCFDDAVRAYVRRRPQATVVALGEGLETGFWRVDNGLLNWLTVELPEAAALRRMLLPDGERRRTLARSVTDHSWLDAVPNPERGVIVTAQGLLMYLSPPEVRDLLAACAERFPGGRLVFDSVPRWISRLSRRGRLKVGNLRLPPMRWGMDAAERPRIASAHPGIVDVRELPLPPGRGLFLGSVAPRQHRIPLLRTLSPTISEVRFGG